MYLPRCKIFRNVQHLFPWFLDVDHEYYLHVYLGCLKEFILTSWSECSKLHVSDSWTPAYSSVSRGENEGRLLAPAYSCWHSTGNMPAEPGKSHLAKNSLSGFWVSWMMSWIGEPYRKSGGIFYLLILEGFGVRKEQYPISPELYLVKHHAQTEVGSLVWLEFF